MIAFPFFSNEKKEILFFCKNAAQWLTDRTTTTVKIGQDKLKQLGSLNLSEHLHETMRARRAVRACVRALFF